MIGVVGAVGRAMALSQPPVAATPGQLPADVTVLSVTSLAAGTLSLPATASTSAAVLTLLPVSLMLATVYQAREIYAASVRDGDLIGVGDYGVRARPLTASVMQLVRPASPGGRAVG